MPTTIEIEVYTASELKELKPHAFNNAMYEFQKNWLFPHWDEIYAVEKEFHERFGVRLEPNYEYPSYSKATRLTFESFYNGTIGGYDYLTSDDIVGQKAISWLLNHHFYDLYEGRYYSKGKYVDGKYQYVHRHSKTIFERHCLTGVCYGLSVTDPIDALIRDRRSIPKGYTLADIFDDCAKALAADVYAEMEHWYSEENFIEMSENNDWRYDSAGRLV